MRKSSQSFLTIAALVFLLFSPASYAADLGDVKGEYSDDAYRAKALLEKAVNYLQERGDKSLAAFSRPGEFTDGDLYVYIVGTDGTLMASGGSSFSYIGRNMLDYKDPDGKRFIQEMVDIAKTKGVGKIDYRWLNIQYGNIERKVTYFQKVDNRIVAVGYYMPRATPEQAKAVLWRAIDELKRTGADAFPRFNDLNGGFIQDDVYVFVVGIKDKKMYAHGSIPRLIGRNVADLRDANNKPIIQQMLDIVKTRTEGSLDYQWRNPVTGKVEKKRTFLYQVGDYMVGVGYYQP